MKCIFQKHLVNVLVTLYTDKMPNHQKQINGKNADNQINWKSSVLKWNHFVKYYLGVLENSF